MICDIHPLTSQFGNREEFFRSHVPANAKILELGPGYNPIFSKTPYEELFTLDRDKQENLFQEYSALINEEAARKIPQIDFICRDGNLLSAIPKSYWGTFDIIVSSHNIEHIPNPIAYVRSVETLLSPTGSFLLAVPDKRSCFDILRPISTTADWLEGLHRAGAKHSMRSRYEHVAYTCGDKKRSSWVRGEKLNALSFSTNDSVEQIYKNILHENEYVDTHAWTFTPTSFQLIFLELQSMGMFSLLPSMILDSSWEFLVKLERYASVALPNETRMNLLVKTCIEQKEGFEALVRL